MTRPNDDFLDALFAQARDEEVQPDDALLARVLADADEVQAGFASVQTAHPVTGSFWARLLDGLGGWPAVSGLAAATVAGIWIGVAPPASVADVTATFFGEELTVPLVASDLGLDAGAFADG